ncbi:MAG TPA: TonB family protein [Steroidobacteraceae bacterium]|nr:TonB family protein [Steroidobacteraceae bacterium]
MSRSIRPAFLRRNPLGLILVMGLHVTFLWALIAGLRIHPPRLAPDSVFTRFLPPELARPLPPPEVVQPAHLATPLETLLPQVQFPEDPPPDAPNASPTEVPLEATGAVAGHEAVLTTPSIDPRSPLTQPPYPAAAIRAGIEGNLALQVLVGPDGRVHDARVVRTSGSALLDQAAIDEALRRWKLRPATRDGVPFEQWYTLRVIFHLQNR